MQENDYSKELVPRNTGTISIITPTCAVRFKYCRFPYPNSSRLHIMCEHTSSTTPAYSAAQLQPAQTPRVTNESANEQSHLTPGMQVVWVLFSLVLAHLPCWQCLARSLPPDVNAFHSITPEITHEHSVISVCCINLQTCELGMTFLMRMCVEKRANSASRFSLLGNCTGTIIIGCLLLFW